MASIQHRPGRPKPWRVRYRNPQGADRSQSFVRKADARAFANSVETDMLRGQYIDPVGSKISFGEFAERWAASLTVDAKTAEGIASRLRAHLLPAFGELELRNLKPSTIQSWLGGLARTHEPSYARLLLGTLSTILGAAVEDGLIASNPCRSRSVKAPALPDARRDAWDVATVDAVGDGLPERYRALVPAGAGLGLRQGEAFGLGVDTIDFLRRKVEVRRQVKWLSGRGLVFAPPKRGKTRTVPLPDVVAVALAEHIRRFPPVEVTLPWTGRGGGEVAVPLVFTNTAGAQVNRGSWNDRAWKPALRRCRSVGDARRGLPHAAARVRLNAAQRRGQRRGGRSVARARRRRGIAAAHVRPRNAVRRPARSSRARRSARGTSSQDSGRRPVNPPSRAV